MWGDNVGTLQVTYDYINNQSEVPLWTLTGAMTEQYEWKYASLPIAPEDSDNVVRSYNLLQCFVHDSFILH